MKSKLADPAVPREIGRKQYGRKAALVAWAIECEVIDASPPQHDTLV